MAKGQAYCDCDVIHEDIVEKVLEKMLEEEVFANLTELFKVLADISRVKILWALCAHELCVCDLGSLLNMSKSAVSHKLNYLRAAQLVDYRKEGRIAFYFIENVYIKKLFQEASKLF
jgi:ArsR family transcriptional regulator